MIPAYAGTISPFTTHLRTIPNSLPIIRTNFPRPVSPQKRNPSKKSPNPPETAENANAGKGVTDTAGDGAGHEPSHSRTSTNAPITPNAVPASKTHKTNPAANLNSEDFRPKPRASTSVPLSGCPCAGDPSPSPFAFRRIRPVPRSIIRRTAPRPPQPPPPESGTKNINEEISPNQKQMRKRTNPPTMKEPGPPPNRRSTQQNRKPDRPPARRFIRRKRSPCYVNAAPELPEVNPNDEPEAQPRS